MGSHLFQTKGGIISFASILPQSKILRLEAVLSLVTTALQ
jgi:hypothetical protein